jgi:MraZ protein
MLIGEYIHAIDDKNRVSMPAKFRNVFGKKMILTPGLDNCLFLFTDKEWQRISEKLIESSSMLSTDTRSFTRYMFGGASEVEVDSAGRILIPEFLKERISLKSKVAMVGVHNRVEIWSEKGWTEYKRGVEKRADSLAEKLSELGIM